MTAITPSMAPMSRATVSFMAWSRTSPVSSTWRLKLLMLTWPASPTRPGSLISAFTPIDWSSVCAPSVRRSAAAMPPVTAPPISSGKQPDSVASSAPHSRPVASLRPVDLVIGVAPEQRDVDAVANTMDGHQMDFLDARGAVGRHADVHVGVGQQLADLAAALAGQRDDAHFALQRRLDGRDDVAGVARRRRS